MPVYSGFMSRVCGVMPRRPAAGPAPGPTACEPACARTASKNSLGIAVTNRGHTYLEFHDRWMSVTQRAGITWSPPTGSMTLRVAAATARDRNWSRAAASADGRSLVVCNCQPAP